MSRLPAPADTDAASQTSRPLLEAVRKRLGSVPNPFRITANSPVALEGHLGLNGALAKRALAARTRERIALAVAGINGWDDCLSATPLWRPTSRGSTLLKSRPTAPAAPTT